MRILLAEDEKALSRALIKLFEKNNYSVPFRYIGKTITVKGYANKVVVYSDGKVIAEHTRLFAFKNGVWYRG